MLQGRTGTGCPSYGEDAGGPPTIPLIRDRRSAIHDLQSFIFASIRVHSWFEIFMFSFLVSVPAKFGDGIE
jgi:predicted metal-binding protein